MSMRRTGLRKIWALLSIAGGLLALGCAAPAAAQSTQPSDRVLLPDEDNDGGYRATKTKSYAAVRERVIKARMLERLRDFLSPVRLPRSIGLLATECEGGEDASPYYYSGNRTITICYQFIALAENIVDKVMAGIKKIPRPFLSPSPATNSSGA